MRTPNMFASAHCGTTHAGAAPFDAERFHAQLEKVMRRVCCAAPRIEARGHELEDFSHTTRRDMDVYELTESPRGRGRETRMRAFEKATDAYFRNTFANVQDSEAPSDDVHVTCTGYVAPSGAQKMVQARGWGKGTRVNAYPMGCYAAIPSANDSTKTVRSDVGDALRLPYGDGAFDVVCAMDFHEHVEDPARAVAEASRVLAPGGLFFFHTFTSRSVLRSQTFGIESGIRTKSRTLRALAPPRCSSIIASAFS